MSRLFMAIMGSDFAPLFAVIIAVVAMSYCRTPAPSLSQNRYLDAAIGSGPIYGKRDGVTWLASRHFFREFPCEITARDSHPAGSKNPSSRDNATQTRESTASNYQRAVALFASPEEKLEEMIRSARKNLHTDDPLKWSSAKESPCNETIHEGNQHNESEDDDDRKADPRSIQRPTSRLCFRDDEDEDEEDDLAPGLGLELSSRKTTASPELAKENLLAKSKNSEPEAPIVGRKDVPAKDDVEYDSHYRMNGKELNGFDSVDENKPAGERLEEQDGDEDTDQRNEHQEFIVDTERGIFQPARPRVSVYCPEGEEHLHRAGNWFGLPEPYSPLDILKKASRLEWALFECLEDVTKDGVRTFEDDDTESVKPSGRANLDRQAAVTHINSLNWYEVLEENVEQVSKDEYRALEDCVLALDGRLEPMKPPRKSTVERTSPTPREKFTDGKRRRSQLMFPLSTDHLDDRPVPQPMPGL